MWTVTAPLPLPSYYAHLSASSESQEDCRIVFDASLYSRWTSPKTEGGKVLDEPKWVLEGSEKGCFSLWKITRNSTGNEFDRGWT